MSCMNLRLKNYMEGPLALAWYACVIQPNGVASKYICQSSLSNGGVQ